jgi:PAS domain S-box-containing protein
MDLLTVQEELEQLRIKLAECEDTLSAIRNGDVDAWVVNNKIFTLQTADYPYRVIIENMFEGATILSSDMDIVYCNRRMAEMLELPLGQITGNKINSIIYPGDHELLEKILKNGKEKSEGFELRINGRTGNIKRVLASSLPLDFENAFMCLIFVDLTEIKKIQSELNSTNDNLDALVLQRTSELQEMNKALIENQAVLKTIIESTSDLISMKKTDGKYFLINSAAANTIFPILKESGIKPEEITIDDLVSPEDAEKIKEIDLKVMKDNKSVSYDYTVKIKGEQRTFSSVKGPCIDAYGKTIGIATISRDITGRKEAEDALRESETRLRALITATSDVVFRSNPEFNRIYYIESWGSYTRIEKTIRNWFELIPEDVRPKVRLSIKNAIKNKSILELEHPFLPGNERRWMFTRAIPLFNDRNEIIEWFGTSSDITDRKNAEEALRESERKYSSLFANKLNAMIHCRIITDRQGDPVDFIFLQVNEAYERIMNLKKENVEGKRVREIYPSFENYSFNYISAYGKVALEQKEIRFEEFFEATGQYLSVYAYCPRKGEFISIFSDVTERKMTEKALVESERRFSVIFHSAPVGISLTNISDGILFDVNQAWLDLAGYLKKEEVIGKTTQQLGLTPLSAHLKYITSGFRYLGKFRNFEETLTDKNGSLHYVLVNVDMIKISGQEFMLSSIEDITDRKRMEDALRESQQRWVTTLASIGDAVISTDTEGKITFMNREAEWLTGWNHREIIHKPVDLILNIIDGATSIPFRYNEIPVIGFIEDRILIHRSGVEIPIDYSIAPIITKDGKSLGIVLIFRDVSKRKEAAEVIRNHNSILEQTVRERTIELEMAKEHAESADRLKTAFLLNMSHELRTPLNSIIGFSGILLKHLPGPLNTEQEKQLEMVQKSGRHLLSLINDILDISKIEAGELVPHYDPFNMTDLIENILKLVEPQAKNKRLTVVFKKSESEITVVSDKIRIRQILINLIINAIKFTSAGVVQVICIKEANSVKVEVSDTGIGIKEEDIDKLFNPFIQLENNLTRKFEGSGLGLSISKKLIDMLHGTIEVKSKYGSGSTFTLNIPLNMP